MRIRRRKQKASDIRVHLDKGDFGFGKRKMENHFVDIVTMRRSAVGLRKEKTIKIHSFQKLLKKIYDSSF